MTTLREAAQRALEAMEMLAQPTKTNSETPRYRAHKAAITALRDALAQEEQEPVACECHRCIKEKDLRDPSGMLPLNMSKMILCAECGNKRCPKASDHMLACTGSNEPGQSGSVYAHPPRREWQSLTDKEISAMFPAHLRGDYKDLIPYSFARAVEQALKEKNYG